MAEAWGDYLDRHRDEIAENFERAAVLIRAGDTHGLAEHVGRNRRARAEAAASTHAASSPEFGTSGTEKSERTAFLQDNADKSQAFPQSAASAPGRDLLLTTLQETGEIQWPMGWPLSWLLDLTDTLGLAPDEISLEGTRIRVMQHA